MGVYRSGGVIALSIINLILAGILIILAIAIQTILIPGEQQGYYFALLDIWLYVSYGTGYAIGLQYLMGSDPYFTISILNIVFWIALIFSILYITSGIGLLSMKNWARILAMTLGIISIIVGIFLFVSLFLYGFLFAILFLALGIATIVYLAGDVKYEFQ